MFELNDDLLQRFITQQDEILAGYQGLRSMVEGLKLHQRRLRGEVRAVRGEIRELSSKLESMKGDGIVLNSTIEAIEEWAQKVDQKLGGIGELAKSSYEMAESALKRLPYPSQSEHAPGHRSSVPSKDG